MTSGPRREISNFCWALCPHPHSTQTQSVIGLYFIQYSLRWEVHQFKPIRLSPMKRPHPHLLSLLILYSYLPSSSNGHSSTGVYNQRSTRSQSWLMETQRTNVPTYHCRNEPVSQWTNVPTNQCRNEPLFQWTNVGMNQCPNVPMSQRTTVATYHCRNVPLSQRTTVGMNRYLTKKALLLIKFLVK